MTTTAFSGEVMLLGWKETHSGGAQVAFLLSDPEELEAFKRMTVAKGKVAGQRLACVLVEIHDDEGMLPAKTADSRPASEEGKTGEGVGESRAEHRPQPNDLARKMHVDGFFRNPRLWSKMEEAGIYTQKQHKEWIESRPCWFITAGIKGGGCSGDIVLHHCNSAAIPAAGKGENPRKPPAWYGVPLCAIGHHQNWAHASHNRLHGATREEKHWLLEQAVALTAGRMKERIKAHLSLESLSQITPEMLKGFEEAIGL